MDSSRFDRFTRSVSTLRTRRGALRVLLGAGALGLPFALADKPTLAFKSVGTCKRRCGKRFTGQCAADCKRCCKKVVGGNKKRCDFGCGFIK
jgi:hypothetical protein